MSIANEVDDKCRVDVEGEMCIYNAASLKEKFMEVLDDPRELEIGLANVTDIDSAGVQLLMLAKRERVAHGRQLMLTGHSSSVIDVFEMMSLVGYFNDPVVLTRDKGEKNES